MFSFTCVIFCPAAISHLEMATKRKSNHHSHFSTPWNSTKTHDGNRCVMSLHQVMKPSVIIMAAANVIKHDVMPKRTSRKSPRKLASISFNAKRVILWTNGISFSPKRPWLNHDFTCKSQCSTQETETHQWWPWNCSRTSMPISHRTVQCLHSNCPSWKVNICHWNHDRDKTSAP